MKKRKTVEKARNYSLRVSISRARTLSFIFGGGSAVVVFSALLIFIEWQDQGIHRALFSGLVVLGIIPLIIGRFNVPHMGRTIIEMTPEKLLIEGHQIDWNEIGDVTFQGSFRKPDAIQLVLQSGDRIQVEDANFDRPLVEIYEELRKRVR